MGRGAQLPSHCLRSPSRKDDVNLERLNYYYCTCIVPFLPTVFILTKIDKWCYYTVVYKQADYELKHGKSKLNGFCLCMYQS